MTTGVITAAMMPTPQSRSADCLTRVRILVQPFPAE
jgi:hypothetical protein